MGNALPYQWEDCEVLRRETGSNAITYLRDEILGKHESRGFLFYSEPPRHE